MLTSSAHPPLCTSSLGAGSKPRERKKPKQHKSKKLNAAFPGTCPNADIRGGGRAQAPKESPVLLYAHREASGVRADDL